MPTVVMGFTNTSLKVTSSLAANLLFPNSFAMVRVLSLWRSIEKKSLNLRLEGRWVGIYTKIHRWFASLEFIL